MSGLLPVTDNPTRMNLIRCADRWHLCSRFTCTPVKPEPARSCNSNHRLVAAFAPFLLLLASLPALAHDRIGSFSHAVVTVEGASIHYYLNLPPTVSSLLQANVGDDIDDLTGFFGMEMRVTTQGRACPLTRVTRSPPLKSGNRIIELLFHCPTDVTELTIQSSLFLDLDESHTQFVRLAPPEDPRKVLHEAVLNESNMVFHVADARSGGSVPLERAVSFARLGIEHLLTGYDHILFLLTVVVGISFVESLKAVTSFTLAHSITMALAFLGEISLPSAIVEPLIAATVVYVAFENVSSRNIRHRWIWTFLFGLIHGLGFVGALKVMTISRSELVLSLVSFNLGIELAQLLVVALAVTALAFIRRYPWGVSFNRGFSTCVGLLGCIWLVQRIMVT